jgi:ABC-type arginine transport system ATPase subunit
MAQLSRPYQILLGVVVVLGLVWAVALRSHASNPSEPVPSSPSTTPAATSSSTTAAAEAKAAAAPTKIYHGAATGVEGLTRAIAKAHGAVATSQENAQQLQHKSGEASAEAQTSTTTTTSANVAAAKSTTSAAAAQKLIAAAALAHAAAVRAHNRAHSTVKPHGGRTLAEIAVERELAQGKTVMLLFWNPKATVDREVQSQASSLAKGSKGTVTVHTALAHQVGMFGKITEVVKVYQTPTILIVNRRGVVSTLTGLTDVFSLEQAVREARRAGL